MTEIKNIIASFINKNPDEITNNTVIDKTVVKGSILIHRMYAALANKGYKVSNYNKIRNYGELLNTLNTNYSKQEIANHIPDEKQSNSHSIKGIGIDIEKYSNLPNVDDFRIDEFYIQNFTPSEISYCILKENPLASFTGLFCIKEAIYKANNQTFNNKNFHHIEINHEANGAPVFPGFIISVSHADDTAVAVAIAV